MPGSVSTATGRFSFTAPASVDVGVPPPVNRPSARRRSVTWSPITKDDVTPSGISAASPAIIGPMSPPPLPRRSTTTPQTPAEDRPSARVSAYRRPSCAPPENSGTTAVAIPSSIVTVGSTAAVPVLGESALSRNEWCPPATVAARASTASASAKVSAVRSSVSACARAVDHSGPSAYSPPSSSRIASCP